MNSITLAFVTDFNGYLGEFHDLPKDREEYLAFCSNFLLNKVSDPDMLWYLVEAIGANIPLPKGQHRLAFPSLAKRIQSIHGQEKGEVGGFGEGKQGTSLRQHGCEDRGGSGPERNM